MIDRRPVAILRCTGPDDVRAAVRFAVQHDAYPAIRAGGHLTQMNAFSEDDSGVSGSIRPASASR